MKKKHQSQTLRQPEHIRLKTLTAEQLRIGIWWDEYWDSDYKTLEDVEADGGSFSNADIMQMNLIRLLKLKRNGIVKLTGLTLDGMESKTVLTHQ